LLGCHLFDGVDSGVLDMFKTVAFKFCAAKPTGDYYDAVADVAFLHDAENYHPRPSFAVVAFGFVDSSLVLNTGCKTVVVSFLVVFGLLKSLKDSFDVISSADKAITDAVAAAAVFDDVLVEGEG